MVATLMANHVNSHSSTRGRPTTPAPQMDVQMGNSGALPPQTMGGTSSTLSVLRRMVSLELDQVIGFIDMGVDI